MCGQEHRMAKCEENDYAKYSCVDCKVAGHALWDCTCPKFKEACRRLEGQDLESSYRYFPCDEPWTWEQVCMGSPIWESVAITGTMGGGTYQM